MIDHCTSDAAFEVRGRQRRRWERRLTPLQRTTDRGAGGELGHQEPRPEIFAEITNGLAAPWHSSITLKTAITIAGVDSQGSSPRYLNSGRSQGRASTSNEHETPPSTTGYARMSCTLHTPMISPTPASLGRAFVRGY
ncbi:hypothetical protein THAOC_33291 [Thalassiosira oceanica]|uniref:Uncharacterized protein n=1 Tax=Thalassiosira oceanica TaxID=159749 RepID=K0RG36_THAOC|nr:hypothetical protein THAOC_33291 [Thalassiosira oceanica]|eukprot:EJK47951.1 hypothetical protein THAOC_33291 [Thalassiosira oceanica]